MLKRLGLILGASVALLVGCEGEEYWNTIEGVEVVDIKTEKACGGCSTLSTITFEKDGATFKLNGLYVNHSLLEEGQKINVYFDDDYYLKKYELPMIKNQ